MNHRYQDREPNFLDKIIHNRRTGWGVNLYRETRKGKIAGVAAGIAEQFDITPWVARILFVTAFIFASPLAFWGYIAAWVLIMPRVKASEADIQMEYSEHHKEYRPKHMFRYTEAPRERLRKLDERMKAASERLAAIETYVTSRQFKLRQEFSRLND